jgi:hypothetical protein
MALIFALCPGVSVIKARLRFLLPLSLNAFMLSRPGFYRCENLVYWLYGQRFLSEEEEEERKKEEIPTSAKQAISQWVLETVHHSFTVTSAYSSFTLAAPHT